MGQVVWLVRLLLQGKGHSLGGGGLAPGGAAAAPPVPPGTPQGPQGARKPSLSPILDNLNHPPPKTSPSPMVGHFRSAFRMDAWWTTLPCSYLLYHGKARPLN